MDILGKRLFLTLLIFRWIRSYCIRWVNSCCLLSSSSDGLFFSSWMSMQFEEDPEMSGWDVLIQTLKSPLINFDNNRDEWKYAAVILRDVLLERWKYCDAKTNEDEFLVVSPSSIVNVHAEPTYQLGAMTREGLEMRSVSPLLGLMIYSSKLSYIIVM